MNDYNKTMLFCFPIQTLCNPGNFQIISECVLSLLASKCNTQFWNLFQEKKVLKDNEAVSSEIVASAHLDNFAMKLFMWADKVYTYFKIRHF